MQSKHAYEFGEFVLDETERHLLRKGQPISLTPKAFDILLVLVRRGGHMVEKDEMLKEVWPDTFVEEATLAQNIFTLRKALGQGKNGNGDLYIETVPKRGYRFVANVKERELDDRDVVLEQHTRAQILIEEEEYEEESLQPESLEQEKAQAETLVATAPAASSRTARRRYLFAGVLILVCVGALIYVWRSR